MWTNIFKIGGFHQVSWFQFLPHESELIPLPDKSAKDAATRLVLSSHVQLQKDGFLSTWTNSFVGPWDPSQGVHNPGDNFFGYLNAALYNMHLQLRRSMSDGMSASSNGPSMQQQEMGMIQERTLPSSPGPLYGSSHSKISGYMKGGLGQPSVRKQLVGTELMDSSRSFLQWVQSISFVGIAIDHSLHLIFQADTQSLGAQGVVGVGSSAYLEGFTPVKSLGSKPASYILIPSPSMRFLPPTPLQLPTCLTAESPPLAYLLHSKGSAIPLSTCFVVSKAVPIVRRDWRSNLSPAYLERRTALPFHCDIVLRLRRLLHFADKELSRHQEKA